MSVSNLFIDIDGERQLSRDILACKTTTVAFKKAVQKAGNLLRRKVRPGTPVASGRTKKSWRRYVVKGADGFFGAVSAGRLRRTRSSRAKYPMTPGKNGRQYIARFLEFGTVKMSARPWIRDAVDANAPEVGEMLMDGFAAPLTRNQSRFSLGNSLVSRRGAFGG